MKWFNQLKNDVKNVWQVRRSISVCKYSEYRVDIEVKPNDKYLLNSVNDS